MISLKHSSKYCNDISSIENYDEALNSEEKYDCHHRLETHTSDGEQRLVALSRDELKALDMFYHRPADELIFLTKKEHRQLHNKYRKYSCRSEETKKKISETKKRRFASGEIKPWNKKD